jgi:hypothetical protein
MVFLCLFHLDTQNGFTISAVAGGRTLPPFLFGCDEFASSATDLLSV